METRIIEILSKLTEVVTSLHSNLIAEGSNRALAVDLALLDEEEEIAKLRLLIQENAEVIEERTEAQSEDLLEIREMLNKLESEKASTKPK